MITSSQRSFEWLIGLEEDIEDFSTETFEETLDRELEQVVRDGGDGFTEVMLDYLWLDGSCEISFHSYHDLVDSLHWR